MDNSIYLFDEAEEAYKKFLKSSKGFLGLKKRSNLKSFIEIQKKENAYNSVHLGIKEVPLDKIIGSVEKYTDFDKNFAPKNNVVKQRWINIYVGYIGESMLPPVILYKIKDNYYVYDGNHRISVAKFLNFASIEAEVEEFLPSKNSTDEIIYRESMIFEKETGIENVVLSNPLRYKHLKNEIENYMKFIHKKRRIEVNYRKAAEDWNKNIFIPAKILIEKNDILKNFPDNNINDTVLFVLDHKYFLSENKGKNVGYLFSIIDYINFIKTNENGNLMNKFEINGKEAEKAVSSLEKIDNEIIHSIEEIRIDRELSKLTGTNFGYNKILYREMEKYKNIQEWHKKEYKKITDCFIEKLDKLPEKYSSYKEYFDENEIFKFIFEYGNLKNIYEYENKETVVLNYIIEVFLPVISILDKENNEAYSSKKDFLNKYIKIQNGYFYLFKIEERLSEEGKTVKYEKIISDRSLNTVFFRDERGYYDIKGILLNQKYNEFLNNLKSSESFLEIYEKYGKIGEYETFTKLFEMLDILGEEKFIKKIKNDLKKMFKSDIILTDYKTKYVMYNYILNKKKSAAEKTEDVFYDYKKYSFIDFYADILYFTKENITVENDSENIDFDNVDFDIDILDMELYYREKDWQE